VIELFTGLSPVVQALLATMFTWGLTALGASLVFGAKNVPRKLLDAMLAFAAGAMIFVVAEELVPEAKRGSPDIAAMSLMVGFSVMMALDVALG
jgi:zinc transporter ZupT